MMLGIQTRALSFFVNRCVRDVLGALLALWVILEAGVLPNSLSGVLMAIWSPTLLAIAVGLTVRDIVAIAAGSTLLFGVVVMLVTYIEAVAIAGLIRCLRAMFAADLASARDAIETAVTED